jgi:hypothetical protein
MLFKQSTDEVQGFNNGDVMCVSIYVCTYIYIYVPYASPQKRRNRFLIAFLRILINFSSFQ